MRKGRRRSPEEEDNIEIGARRTRFSRRRLASIRGRAVSFAVTPRAAEQRFSASSASARLDEIA